MGKEEKRERRGLKKQRKGKKRGGRKQLGREDVLYVGYLGIWPVTAEIEERKRDWHRCP